MHLEPFDLDQNGARRIGQGDVEGDMPRHHGQIGRQAHPAADLGLQWRMDPDRAVGHRYPERFAIIAGGQFDGPASGQVEQAGMHPVPFVKIAAIGFGQRQPGQPLTRTARGRTQHLPAWAELQMPFLRTVEHRIGRGTLCLGAAAGDGGQVERFGLCLGRGHQSGLRVLGIAAAGQRAPDGKGDAVRRVLQPDHHLARGAVHPERAEEIEIADVIGVGDALRVQRLRGQFQIAGAR